MTLLGGGLFHLVTLRPSGVAFALAGLAIGWPSYRLLARWFEKVTAPGRPRR
ncbi:hypothetical protein [Streptomyces sp. NPDC050504]|uniref:hypothetical protein n=1 Tax=Streptomyces sp. NPDC050504 TaxID=3365618 RepID=UPI0037BD835E